MNYFIELFHYLLNISVYVSSKQVFIFAVILFTFVSSS